jgi:hypothetical protein
MTILRSKIVEGALAMTLACATEQIFLPRAPATALRAVALPRFAALRGGGV